MSQCNGKVRIILDLSRCNDAVEKIHFKMNNIQTALNMIVPGGFMSSLDLQNAYFTFPIAFEDWKCGLEGLREFAFGSLAILSKSMSSLRAHCFPSKILYFRIYRR